MTPLVAAQLAQARAAAIVWAGTWAIVFCCICAAVAANRLGPSFDLVVIETMRADAVWLFGCATTYLAGVIAVAWSQRALQRPALIALLPVYGPLSLWALDLHFRGSPLGLPTFSLVGAALAFTPIWGILIGFSLAPASAALPLGVFMTLLIIAASRVALAIRLVRVVGGAIAQAKRERVRAACSEPVAA